MLGLNVTPPKKANAYPRGAIFAWTLRPEDGGKRPPNDEAEEAEEEVSAVEAMEEVVTEVATEVATMEAMVEAVVDTPL